jgi:ribose 5-phosphate isomerase B
MKIAIGADHNGYDLKEAVKAHVESLGHEVEGVTCSARGGNSVDSGV